VSNEFVALGRGLEIGIRIDSDSDSDDRAASFCVHMYICTYMHLCMLNIYVCRLMAGKDKVAGQFLAKTECKYIS